MKGGSATRAAPSLATLFQEGTVAGLSDDQLLDRFLGDPGEVADRSFEALVDRHGSMVLGICRRSLGNLHDAEDVAQATFLVLARRARSIRKAQSVSCWLIGVASRLASRARADSARRRVRDREAGVPILVERPDPVVWPELHEGIARLPDKYRAPIILCYFEGLSHDQAAQQIGCPTRTIQTRLARARERLRRKLGGFESFPATGRLLVLPDPWKQSTVEAARSFASSGILPASLSPIVRSITTGALNTMILTRAKWAAAAILLIAAAAGGYEELGHPQPITNVEEPFQVKMVDGTTVEVIGISTSPTGPKTWWRPDGSSMIEPSFDPIDLQVDDSKAQVRTIVVRVSGQPEGSTLKWGLPQSRSTAGGRPTRNGVRVPGLEYYVASFEAGRTDCEVKVRVASETWKSEGSHGGTGGYSFYQGGHKFYFGKARPHQGGTAIAVANNLVGLDTRLVAVDHAGKVYQPTYASGGGGEVLSLLDAEFPLPPEQIATYRVESRAFEEKAIRAVPLNPRN